MFQVLQKVEIKDISKKRYNDADKSFYLKGLESSVGKPGLLQGIIETQRSSLFGEGCIRWGKAVQTCVDEFSVLNRTIYPAYSHSKSAARLLVNEVVKKVADFNETFFDVDEYQNSSDNNNEERFLGWGLVDFIVSNKVVIKVFGDNEGEREMEKFAVPTEASHR